MLELTNFNDDRRYIKLDVHDQDVIRLKNAPGPTHGEEANGALNPSTPWNVACASAYMSPVTIDFAIAKRSSITGPLASPLSMPIMVRLNGATSTSHCRRPCPLRNNLG